jgi:hypothetical protein
MSKVTNARVPLVEQMSDETFIRHLEARHSGDLAMEFKPMPGREGEPRRLLTRIAHETYHDLLHRRASDAGATLDHHHDYPLVAKTSRPTGQPGMVIRDKQTKKLLRWDGVSWKQHTQVPA